MTTYDKFSIYYDEIYSSYDYEGDCEYLQRLFDRYCKTMPKSVLDLGCGTGNHSIPLALKGFNVSGLDLSKRQIESAMKKAQKHNVTDKTQFLHGDMRNFSLEKQFDASIIMFGSFGYLLSDEDVKNALERINLHLKSNGLLVLEFWAIGGLKHEASERGYRTWDKIETPEHVIIRIAESKFDEGKCALRVQFDFIVYSEKTVIDEFSETHMLRLYSLGELRTFLLNAGFEIVGIFETESFDQAKANSFRPIAVARKST